jgi:hypothetical protein
MDCPQKSSEAYSFYYKILVFFHMPNTQLFRRRYPTGTVEKRKKGKVYFHKEAGCCHSKEMHLTQYSANSSSKASSKNIVSKYCPNRAVQCNRIKYSLRKKY